MNTILHGVHALSLEWDGYRDVIMSHDFTSSGYHSLTSSTGRRGRPRFDISRDQLEYLFSMSFTWTDITTLLGVSRMTVYRRRLEYGMLRPGREITDARLNTLLLEMRADFPDMGEVMVIGRLRALGYRIRRYRVRNAIRSTDPLNTALRGRIVSPYATWLLQL